MSESYHIHDERDQPGNIRYTVCRGPVLNSGRCSSKCRPVGAADTLWGAKIVARRDRKRQAKPPFWTLPAKELDLD